MRGTDAIEYPSLFSWSVFLNELSLFSGVGGGILAAKLLGWTTVGAVEIDKYCRRVLRRRQDEGILPRFPIFRDVKAFDGKPWRGLVDVVSGGFPCFAAGTMVLCKDGYRPIESVVVGDYVLTHRGRWRRVTSVMVKGGARLRTIKAQGVPGVVTTDEHPFFGRSVSTKYENRKRTRVFAEPRWINAEDVDGRVFLGQVLPPVVRDGNGCPFWWLVGRYLADGWRVRRKRTGAGRVVVGDQGRVVICCNKSERDELSQRIKDAGYYACEVEERTVVKFHIVSPPLYRFLGQFGKGAEGKRLPAVALGLCREKSLALFTGYATGDGGRRKSAKGKGFHWRITTVSKALALGVALLAQRAFGVVASVRKYVGKSSHIIEGRTVSARPQWFITVPDRNRSAFVENGYGWKKVRSNVISGRGTVWNISVDEDESYVADGAIVHNCQPFSVAGKKKGADDERNFWPETLRVIREVGPPIAFLENVPGLLSYDYFGQILGDLAESGYDAEWDIVSAASVGAPHLRERLWIVAYRNNADFGKDGCHRSAEQNMQEEKRQGKQTSFGDDIDRLDGRTRGIGSHSGRKRPRQTDSRKEIASYASGAGLHGSAKSQCVQETIRRQRDLPDAVEPRRSRKKTPTDAGSAGLEGYGKVTSGTGEEHTSSGDRGWWEVEPDVVRVVHGVPFAMERIRGLGNAQVPVVAAKAFRLLARRAGLGDLEVFCRNVLTGVDNTRRGKTS